jgi:hypothetical protein
MDVLIDLIIYVIRQMTKDKPSRITPAGFEAIERQKAATEQRIAEMQAAVARQQGRTKPLVKRGPARGAAVPAAVSATPSLSQTPDIWTTPAPGIKAPSVVMSSRGRAPLKGLRIPIILGEVLGPPIALREREM